MRRTCACLEAVCNPSRSLLVPPPCGRVVTGPRAAAWAVLDLTVGEARDAVALALTHAQRTAAERAIVAAVSSATGVSVSRVRIVGLGPRSTGGGNAASSSSLTLLNSTGTVDGTVVEAMGTRVELHILPRSSRAVVSSAAATLGGLDALALEPTPQDAVALLNASSGPWWVSGGVLQTGDVQQGTGAAAAVEQAGGLSTAALVALVCAGAVVVALVVGVCMGRVLFSGWWCCVHVSGRGVSASEKRSLERAERGERSVMLANRRRSSVVVAPMSARRQE